MTTTTLTSREFNQDTGRAKQAARMGPVIITDRGEPSHVLLSIDDYRRLSASAPSMVDLLAATEDDIADFDAPRLSHALIRPADFDPSGAGGGAA